MYYLSIMALFLSSVVSAQTLQQLPPQPSLEQMKDLQKATILPPYPVQPFPGQAPLQGQQQGMQQQQQEAPTQQFPAPPQLSNPNPGLQPPQQQQQAPNQPQPQPQQGQPNQQGFQGQGPQQQQQAPNQQQPQPQQGQPNQQGFQGQGPQQQAQAPNPQQGQTTQNNPTQITNPQGPQQQAMAQGQIQQNPSGQLKDFENQDAIVSFYSHEDKNLKWVPCRGNYPENCEMSILHGDLGRPESDYYVRIPPKAKLDPHIQTSTLHMTVVKGPLKFRYYDQKEFTMKDGSFIYMPPNLPREAKCESSKSCIIFVHYDKPSVTLPYTGSMKQEL